MLRRCPTSRARRAARGAPPSARRAISPIAAAWSASRSSAAGCSFTSARNLLPAVTRQTVDAWRQGRRAARRSGREGFIAAGKRRAADGEAGREGFIAAGRRRYGANLRIRRLRRLGFAPLAGSARGCCAAPPAPCGYAGWASHPRALRPRVLRGTSGALLRRRLASSIATRRPRAARRGRPRAARRVGAGPRRGSGPRPSRVRARIGSRPGLAAICADVLRATSSRPLRARCSPRCRAAGAACGASERYRPSRAHVYGGRRRATVEAGVDLCRAAATAFLPGGSPSRKRRATPQRPDLERAAEVDRGPRSDDDLGRPAAHVADGNPLGRGRVWASAPS